MCRSFFVIIFFTAVALFTFSGTHGGQTAMLAKRWDKKFSEMNRYKESHGTKIPARSF